MASMFDLNESQCSDEEMNWSQVSQVLSSQNPRDVSMSFPPPSLSRAFSRPPQIPHASRRPLNSPPPIPHATMQQAVFATNSPFPGAPVSRGLGDSMPSSPPSSHFFHPQRQYVHGALQPALAIDNNNPMATPYMPCMQDLPSTLPSSFDPLHDDRPPPCPQSRMHAPPMETISDTPMDTEDIPLSEEDEGNMEACEEEDEDDRVTKSPPQNPLSKKRPATSKGKNSNANEKTKKQSTAKARRQKLADGESSTFRDHWSIEEFTVLADAKLRLDKEMTEARGKNTFLSLDERWRRVSTWCKAEKVKKSPLQCRDKWENTFPKYKKIRDWDRAVPSGKNTYALMSRDERIEGGFPKTFDKRIFDILDKRFGVDVLVDPGPILIDSSTEALENLNSSTLASQNAGGGSAPTQGAGTSRGSGANTSTTMPAGGASTAVSGERSPNSTGKKRGKYEKKATSIKQEFQDISKNLLDIWSVPRRKEQSNNKSMRSNNKIKWRTCLLCNGYKWRRTRPNQKLFKNPRGPFQISLAHFFLEMARNPSSCLGWL